MVGIGRKVNAIAPQDFASQQNAFVVSASNAIVLQNKNILYSGMVDAWEQGSVSGLSPFLTSGQMWISVEHSMLHIAARSSLTRSKHEWLMYSLTSYDSARKRYCYSSVS